MQGATRTLLTLAILAIALPAARAGAPQMMNYQGKLTDSTGAALTGTYAMDFAIYDDSTGGTVIWSESHAGVSTGSDGLFNVILGSTVPIHDTVFSDTSRWLEVAVGGDTLESRVRLLTVPYAYRVSTVDGSTGGLVSGDVSIASDLTVSGKATIGPGHVNTGASAFVAGANNTVSGSQATIGGGAGNTASDEYTAVGGGESDTASAPHATVGGGMVNVASGNSATVGGGFYNTASGHIATVGGGQFNCASATQATVSGGYRDTASASYATVSGGFENTASAEHATVSGGYENAASGYSATVSGGSWNTASYGAATVSGGSENTASYFYTTVSGGFENTASAEHATVSGGAYNAASGMGATVGGGSENTASGYYATVPGGRYCDASGSYSLAAGYAAKALHMGCFVWADSSGGEVASDVSNQFKVRASNGFRLASDAGSAKAISMGDRYRDNGIVAWGKVASDGSLDRDFGVTSVVRNGTGNYTVTLDVAAMSAADLVPVANVEIDTQPTSPVSFRMVAINQQTASSFDVYIMNGYCAPTDNDFVFIVTGR